MTRLEKIQRQLGTSLPDIKYLLRVAKAARDYVEAIETPHLNLMTKARYQSLHALLEEEA